MTGRIGSWWSHSKTVPLLIWLLSAFIFFSLFHMGLRNYSDTISSFSIDSPISTVDRRSKLYDKMASDLDEHGAAFLKHGETSQSLSLSDIFTLKDDLEELKNIFNPYFDKNTSVYHFNIFHASHHISPVPATKQEIEAEAEAVQAVSRTLCPLNIVLDRVILTSTGALLGCWQVASGTDSIRIRAKLRNAVPRAPEKQLYDAAILHTSFARLLGPPKASPSVGINLKDLFKFVTYGD